MIIDTLLEIFTRPIAKIIANKQKRTFFVDNRTQDNAYEKAQESLKDLGPYDHKTDGEYKHFDSY